MKNNQRIVIILPRGEAIRNFVYSGALDSLESETDLHLISVIPNDEIGKMLYSRYKSVSELRDYKEHRIVKVLREILDMAHGRWLWSGAAQHRWRYHDNDAKTKGQTLTRTAKKIAAGAFANQIGLKLCSKLERAASRALRTTDDYLNLYKNLKPTLVFNSSHVHSRVATPAVEAAQWLGIPTATFIFSWDNLTSQGRIMQPYDFYIVWNNSLREQLLKIYSSIKPEQVFVVGTPQFDFHFREEFYWSREEFCQRVGIENPSRPIVLYTTGMANHMPGEDIIVEGIAKMLREMTDFESPQLVVRIYPKDQTGRFEKIKQRNPDILFPKIPWEPKWQTPRYEDAFLLTNMLRHADVGINIASTVSLELSMLDKPVINVSYNPKGVEMGVVDFKEYYEFDHYRPIVKSGAVEVVKSEDEMCVALKQALREPQTKSKERQALTKRMFEETLDGQCSERMASCLLKLVRQEMSGKTVTARTELKTV